MSTVSRLHEESVNDFKISMYLLQNQHDELMEMISSPVIDLFEEKAKKEALKCKYNALYQAHNHVIVSVQRMFEKIDIELPEVNTVHLRTRDWDHTRHNIAKLDSKLSSERELARKMIELKRNAVPTQD